MNKGGSKQKGAQFERDMCRKLSLWVTHNERDDVFWRSAMSGGAATVALKHGRGKRSAQAGDVSSIHAVGQAIADEFVIECKFYKELSLHQLVYPGKQGLKEFWVRVRKEARQHEKRPMLIAKENRRPILVCINGQTAMDIRKACGLRHRVQVRPQGMHIYLLDEFLEMVDPEIFGSYAKTDPSNS